jgi:hypothetical protein
VAGSTLVRTTSVRHGQSTPGCWLLRKISSTGSTPNCSWRTSPATPTIVSGVFWLPIVICWPIGS